MEKFATQEIMITTSNSWLIITISVINLIVK
jgi:hypothetical protein